MLLDVNKKLFAAIQQSCLQYRYAEPTSQPVGDCQDEEAVSQRNQFINSPRPYRQPGIANWQCGILPYRRYLRRAQSLTPIHTIPAPSKNHA